jgi:hypothetical protein
MKQQIKKSVLCGSLLALASFASHAGVSLSIDNSVTLGSSTAWSGTPAISMLNPNQNTSVDGNVSDGIIFKPTTSFILGAFEFYSAGIGNGSGIGTYNLSLFNLGSGYTIPGASPIYTFSGSEVNLFTPGLNFTTATTDQFNVLTFSGADQVSLNTGDSYLLLMTTSSGNNMVLARGGTTANQALGVNNVVVGANGTVLNNVPAGQRTPIAAFYAVPEPTAATLFGIGAALLFVLRRKNS